jgi:hypothetical protein
MQLTQTRHESVRTKSLFLVFVPCTITSYAAVRTELARLWSKLMFDTVFDKSAPASTLLKVCADISPESDLVLCVTFALECRPSGTPLEARFSCHPQHQHPIRSTVT